jgi:hypothetical protein
VKTDDLIDLLSTNLEPVPRRQVGWILGGAIAVAAAVAVAAMVFAHGIRPDVGQANVWVPLLLKLGFAIGILVPASIYLIRLARPGGERKISTGLVALPFAVVMLLAAANLAFAPVSHWDHLVTGRDWLECLLSIPIIAVVPFTVLVLVVRRMAPTDLVRTGALAGLVAGSISAAGYALHCVDDSMPFVALWYGGTIALCTLAGAKLGPRLLRW